MSHTALVFCAETLCTNEAQEMREFNCNFVTKIIFIIFCFHQKCIVISFSRLHQIEWESKFAYVFEKK